MIDTMTPLQMMIASAILTVTGQIGDLAFSAIKRNFGIKDFPICCLDMAVCWIGWILLSLILFVLI